MGLCVLCVPSVRPQWFHSAAPDGSVCALRVLCLYSVCTLCAPCARSGSTARLTPGKAPAGSRAASSGQTGRSGSGTSRKPCVNIQTACYSYLPATLQ
ncbi:hypothetical protein DV515_00000513 [Chloebia gouldiae]|uniref:Uncharacterized protein n=1 Tax=Chloebia gouldiae TaxID=44316 RepID=A0A3L8T1B6_CHLGU|nr:hypothetical protein DV515_00000513 [Chloebia gouldiae]